MSIRSFFGVSLFIFLQIFLSVSGVSQHFEVRHVPVPTAVFQISARQFMNANARAKSAQERQKKDEDRPNIIFLLTDDHRADALGVMGNKYIQTPNLDALAKRGILFKKTYVTTSICCVSRASLLSGQYMSRHKVKDFTTCFTKKALDKTYPALLKGAGYKIGFIGKFGLDSKRQPDTLFDYWACGREEQPPYWLTNKSGQKIHQTDSVGKDVRKFLNLYAGQGPFCLSVSFKAPHEMEGDYPSFPYQEKFKDLYKGLKLPDPLTADAKYYNSLPQFFRDPRNIGRVRWTPILSTAAQREETTKNYYRLITGVDEVVGNLVAQLRTLGIEKNTIIIFMGDNGFALGEHGFEGKWFGFEESIHVPLIISGLPLARKLKDKEVDKIALNIDIAPTILHLAKVAVPAGMQGIDLIKLSKNDIKERKDFFYEHTFMGSPQLPKVEGVVSKNFKYMKYIEHNYEEFYNTRKDPHETNNLVKARTDNSAVNKARIRYNELKNSVR